MAKKRFTQIGVLPETQKKLSVLASTVGPSIYELVEIWTNEAWEKARKDGLVTDTLLKMIQSQINPSPVEKKRTARSGQVAVAA